MSTKRKKRQPSEAQNNAAAAKRAALCKMSAQYRGLLKQNNEAVAKALLEGGNVKWPNPNFAGCLKINDFIQRQHEMSTGQTEWNTFKGWKEEGYTVNKGEKGFIVWGAPRKFKAKAEVECPKGETKEVEAEYRAFPISYLFHSGQVTDEQGQPHKNYNPFGKLVSIVNMKPMLALPCHAA